MELKDILTLFFSLGAIVFSFLSYKRGNRFENENHLFKTKVDTYTKVLAELQKLIRLLEDNIEEAKEYLKNPNEENFEILNDLADEVDEACFLFNDFVIANSVIIPKQVIDSLSQFCDKVLDTETLDSETRNTEEDIREIETKIDELVEEADHISDSLRKDLHIDELNSSLYRRLKV